MLTSQIKNEVKYNYIDYKQPINAIQNDSRTATYLGHRYFKQNDYTTPPMRTSIITPTYTLHQKEMRYNYDSEQASQYTPKYNFDRTNKADLTICCSRPTFAKSMEHRIFNRPPKPIRSGSTQSRDYGAKSLSTSDYVILNPMSCVGNRSGCLSDLDEEGCYKYDSTNMNVFKAPTGDHIPPGCTKNTVTFWNYNQAPKFRQSDFPKQRIVGNTATFLKHNGMKSEKQRAYIVPVEKRFNCDGIVIR